MVAATHGRSASTEVNIAWRATLISRLAGWTSPSCIVCGVTSRQWTAVAAVLLVMARRVQDLASIVTEEYGGDASRIWRDAADGADLRKRISGLPGFGEMTVKSLGAVLWKRFGVPAAEALDPGHPTLGDVDSPQALEEYQAKKRAHKAKMRADRSA